MTLNFEQLKEAGTIGKLQEFERDFDKLPEVNFKLDYNKENENFAEDLLEDLK